jgi:hypothetical protein
MVRALGAHGQSRRTEPAADGDSEIVRGQTKLVLAFSTLAALAAATSNSATGMGA